MGFNGVRKHQKVEDPRFLYWADKLGLLVSAEMANAYLFEHDAVARMTREWIERFTATTTTLDRHLGSGQ